MTIEKRLETIEIHLGLRPKPKTALDRAHIFYEEIRQRAKRYGGFHPDSELPLDYFFNYGPHQDAVVISLGRDMAELVEMYRFAIKEKE